MTIYLKRKSAYNSMDKREFIIYNIMRTLEVMKMFREDWEVIN